MQKIKAAPARSKKNYGDIGIIATQLFKVPGICEKLGHLRGYGFGRMIQLSAFGQGFPTCIGLLCQRSCAG
jgi:hypothetical protein